MDLVQLAIFGGIALVYGAFLPRKWREWALLIVSVLALYALQPTLTIRWLDYSLPTAMLVITVFSWKISQPTKDDAPRTHRYEDLITLALIIGIALILTLTRYVSLPELLMLTSRPPETLGVVVALGLAFGIGASIWRLTHGTTRWISMALLGLIALFIVVKTAPIATFIASILRLQAGQDASLASANELNWLGFSYVAFRLIATLRDRQTGILPAVSLREYVSYVIFFPSLTAGPIARIETQNSFLQDFRALPALNSRDATRITQALTRIAVGVFKKFVIADSLAVFALNGDNATQAVSSGALWIMLYAYALRLFFDFSGYTDIAIGVALLFGIQLPENFDRPYLKHNITAFWQSWHKSLSDWVRFYVFSPLSRHLLRRKPKPSTEMIMLICNLSTMLIIGLWHGVTIPFFIWGLWHGLGLWGHKLWTDKTRKWYISLKDKPRTKLAWTIAGWGLTFHFVVLGWVWFALPEFDTAWRVFIGLFGVMQ